MVIPVTAMDDHVVEVCGCKVESVKQDVHHSLECCWEPRDRSRVVINLASPSRSSMRGIGYASISDIPIEAAIVHAHSEGGILLLD